MNRLFEFDREYLKDFDYLAGADEAGRGAGAGSVFAAAVCFKDIDAYTINELEGINDSKQLSMKERERLYEIITKKSIWAVHQGSTDDIERLNILRTSLFTMKKCIEEITAELSGKKIIAVIDGNKRIPQLKCAQEAVVKGDEKSASAAAASIIAKVSRDRYMLELDKEFPMYGWAENKGYMTPQHLEAVNKYGLSKYHRKKFFEKFLDNSRQLSFNLQ